MTSRCIAVLGGGHGARTVAADLALAGLTIRLFEFEQFHDHVLEIFESKEDIDYGQSPERRGHAGMLHP
ncbi:MAG: hypothetical protein V1800_18125 [Candidatus Latescibacterota bacterium]